VHHLSTKVENLAPSKTVEISNLAFKLKNNGIDVISFSAGEPDFDTPNFIKEAAKKAIDNGFTKYTPVKGLPILIEAIINKLKRENDLEFNNNQIIITTGAKQAITLALDALVDKGDEVIIPAPYWVSYPEMVKLSGGIPQIIPTFKEEGYKISYHSLKKAINKRTKALILNSPANPTGSIYTKQELEKIAEICIEHTIYIISDEIYEHIIFDGKHISIASLDDKIKRITIVINGCSKAYAMTGWRIGYAAGEAEIITGMAKIMSQRTTNTCSISQIAAVTALNGDKIVINQMVEEYRKRRDYMVKGLNEIGISCEIPPATFYLFPDISFLFKKRYDGKQIRTAVKLCMLLLEKENIAIVPGEPFGSNKNIRISFATSIENIKKGLKRIKRFLSKLS